MSSVYISSVTTRYGDTGRTKLSSGEDVKKSDPRVIAYGGVDELISILGLVRAKIKNYNESIYKDIFLIQKELFLLGGELSSTSYNIEDTSNSIQEENIKHIEEISKAYQKDLKPLKSFIIPGNNEVSAYLHIGRTVCRRVERDIVSLFETTKIRKELIIYLNRLSDLLFIYAWNLEEV